MSNTHSDVKFVLLMAEGWNDRIPEVLAAVRRVGGEVTSIDQENGIVEARIQSTDLQRLKRLGCFRRSDAMGGDDARSRPAAPHVRARRRYSVCFRRRRSVRPTDLRLAAKGRQSARRLHGRQTAKKARSRPLACRGSLAGVDRAVFLPECLDLPQRLSWTVDGGIPRNRRPGRFAVSPGARLAYVCLSLLGIGIAARAFGSDSDQSIAQLLSGFLLAVTAALAACGLGGYRLLRGVCTALSLWLLVSMVLLQRPFSAVDVALGLTAFEVAGCTSESIDDTRPEQECD